MSTNSLSGNQAVKKCGLQPSSFDLALSLTVAGKNAIERVETGPDRSGETDLGRCVL